MMSSDLLPCRAMQKAEVAFLSVAIYRYAHEMRALKGT